jgi:hypothetical protein
MKGMKKLIWKLRNRIRRWLGIGELFMGVDISGNQRDQSAIVIVSRLRGGSVRIIDTHFPSIGEVDRLVKELQHRYGISYKDIYLDAPTGFRNR